MSRRQVAWLVLAPAVVGVSVWLVGADLWKSLLAAAATALLISLGGLTDATDDGHWPAEEETGRDRGVRRDVSRLSWSLVRQDGRVQWRPTLRLQTLAERRLLERGLDLVTDADTCRRLLGPGAYAALTATANRPPRFADFVAAVAAVERLGELDE